MPITAVDEKPVSTYDYRASLHLAVSDMAPKNNNAGGWVGFAGLLLTLILAIIGGTLWVDSRFGQVDTKLTKLQDAINTLAAQQPEWLKQLVEKLLAEAQTKADHGDAIAAAQAARTVAVLIDVERKNKKSAGDSFFLQTLAGIESLQTGKRVVPLQIAALQAKVALADYRSSLEQRTQVDLSKRPATKVIGTLIEDSLFEHMTIRLDGNTWINNTFVDSHIIYGGGHLTLVGTKFINCTFEVTNPNSDWANRVLEYAIIKTPELRLIGSQS